MEQKTKFILTGLAGLSVISFFLFLQTLNSKQPLMRENQDLKNENTTLNTKIAQLENNLRDNANKLNALNSELDRVSKEKQELEKSYDLIAKEKKDLTEKLRSRQASQQISASQPQVAAVAQATDAYWGEVVKAKADLELQLPALRNELKTARIGNEELQREKNLLQLEIKNLSRDNEDLKRQFDYNQKLIDSISQDLVREKNDKIQIQNNLKTLKAENRVLTRILKGLNTRKINLERKVQELEEKNSSIERSAGEMETMLKDRALQISELKEQLDYLAPGEGAAKAETAQRRETVELPEIVVRPRPEEPAPESTSVVPREGKVLAVNRENNFVIIDLGQVSGLAQGDILQVYRENNKIAAIEVIQLRQDIAACDIKNEATEITIGDTVR
jgi:chromosome segregation ATPase